MKLIVPFLALLIAVPLLAKDIVVSEREYSVATNLKDQLKWKLAGATFEFVQNGETCDLKSQDGVVIHSWGTSLEVSGAVASEKGTALLVRVMTAKGFYHGITRLRLKNGGWVVDEVMLDKHPAIKIRDRWVRELGAVSDDGSEAIVHVGAADSDRTPERQGFRMFYGWETWDLNATKKLGSGLKMSNGKKG